MSARAEPAWVVTRPTNRVNGSGWVNIMGAIPGGLRAEDAIELGHRLVEAGIAARVPEEVDGGS